VIYWRQSVFPRFGRLLNFTRHLVILLVAKIKSRVKGYHLQTCDSVQKTAADGIETLTESDFQFCFEAWTIHWAMHVATRPCCSERDNADLKLRGLNMRANYTDRATAACQRS
jgi:hypothetical protein